MSGFKVELTWTRDQPDFDPKTYDRTHTVKMAGGFSYSASAAPDFSGRRDLPNPEEALLAALSSCHMLTFLAIAANSKIVVDSYEESCTAHLEKNDQGKWCFKRVLLKPLIRFAAGSAMTPEKLQKLHEKAHANCIVANSLGAAIAIEPVPAETR